MLQMVAGVCVCVCVCVGGYVKCRTGVALPTDFPGKVEVVGWCDGLGTES